MKRDLDLVHGLLIAAKKADTSLFVVKETCEILTISMVKAQLNI